MTHPSKKQKVDGESALTSVKAVVLVGGASKGTRFRPLSMDCPKPLFPVAGMPMVEHHIKACASVENSITVTSTGDGDLEVLEMLIEGSGWGFAESISFPFTLGPGESRELLLVGSQGEGLLRILSDAAQNPELQVPLESLADAAPTA